MNKPRLSVVQIQAAQRERAVEAMERWAAQTAVDQMELVWIDIAPEAGTLPTHPKVRLRVIEAPDVKTFAGGMARCAAAAECEYVAFIEDHCFPQPQFVEKLIEDFDRTGAAMVNYAFDDYHPQTWISKSFLMAEYGRWMVPTRPGPVAIPACNNVSYRREVLQRYSQERSLQEWFNVEYLFHRRIREDGGLIWQSTEAVAEHVDWVDYGDGLHANAVMKRLNAGTNAESGWSWPKRLFYAAAMPVAPLVHLGRLAISVAPRPALWGTFLAGLPISASMYAYVSFHEALGYLFGRGESERQFAEMELALPRR